jgi:hypothetical protein
MLMFIYQIIVSQGTVFFRFYPFILAFIKAAFLVCNRLMILLRKLPADDSFLLQQFNVN